MSSDDESSDSFEVFLQWKRQRLRNAPATPPNGVTAAATPVAQSRSAPPASAAPHQRQAQPKPPVEVASSVEPKAAAAVETVAEMRAVPVVLAKEPEAVVVVKEETPLKEEPRVVEEVRTETTQSREVVVAELAVPLPAAVPIAAIKEDTSEDSDHKAAPFSATSNNNGSNEDKVKSVNLLHDNNLLHDTSTEDDAVSNKGKEEALPPSGKAAPPTLWANGAVDLETENTLVAAPFDAKAWTAAFRQAKADNDEGRVAMLRRVVQRGTNEAIKAKAYEKEGRPVKLLETGEAVKRTLFYDGKSAFGSFARSHQTTAHFVKADSVDVALFLMDKKNVNPVVLVMADEKKPGGSHAEGTCAQEESIYRRTTLKLALEDPDQVDSGREWHYDLPPFGGIYAPDVQVFRTSESRGYEFLPQPKKVSFICASSLVRPVLVERKKKGDLGLSEEDVKITRKKIETILSIALQNGHDAIVLSAFGCGYNKNPPRHMAQLFRQVITENFAACYRHVTFAIIDDENTHLAHNPEGNVKPFQETFLEASTRASSKKCSIM